MNHSSQEQHGGLMLAGGPSNETQLHLAASPARASVNVGSQQSSRRLAVIPDKGHDHVVAVQNGLPVHYLMHPEKIDPGQPIPSEVSALSVSNPVAVKSKATGDGFDLLLIWNKAGGSSELRCHRFRNGSWKDSEFWASVFTKDRDAGFVGDPAVTTTAASDGSYFTAVITSANLHLFSRLADGKTPTSVILESPFAGDNRITENGGKLSSVALCWDQATSTALAFLADRSRMLQWKLNPGLASLGQNKTSGPACASQHGKLAGACGTSANNLSTPNLVAAVSDGLVNHYFYQSAWNRQTIMAGVGFGRPEIAVVGHQLVVVARSGQRLYSFTTTPDYSKAGGPRVWRSLPPFGNAVTSDPVLFWKPSRQTRQQCLVAAVEVAQAGAEYFWFDGFSWITGWP